jgi:hypothetical protein
MLKIGGHDPSINNVRYLYERANAPEWRQALPSFQKYPESGLNPIAKAVYNPAYPGDLGYDSDSQFQAKYKGWKVREFEVRTNDSNEEGDEIEDPFGGLNQAEVQDTIDKVARIRNMLREQEKQTETDQFLATLQKLIDQNKTVTDGTRKQRISLINTLRKFSEAKSFELSFRKMDMEFYSAFGDYILFYRDSYNANFGKYIRILKMLLLECESEHGIDISSGFKWKRFKVLTEETVGPPEAAGPLESLPDGYLLIRLLGQPQRHL